MVDNFDLFENKKSNLLEGEKKYVLHPFVKWAGGKTQLLDKLKEYLPESFGTLYEPFVGGGSFFLSLGLNDVHINDYNEELIDAYDCFKNIDFFNKLKSELKKHENSHCEEYYYKIREMDREEGFSSFPPYIHAARLIYLNKACFNGLYRVNAKGYFNVPFGKKESVSTFNETNFNNLLNYFLQNKVTITNTDFEEATKDAKSGDLIYFDPPYDTLDSKNSFTSYSKNGFGRDEQLRLCSLCKELDGKGVYVMLSNHNTEFIRSIYKDFKIHVVNAKRMINSDASKRGNVEEVIITNY